MVSEVIRHFLARRHNPAMPRILLIDDDEHLAAPLTTYFARFGCTLESAVRPSEGLAKLRAGTYDAAILDVMLPEMDGFELCREIRKESDIPIVMLTARGEVMDRVVGLELGADDYVPKPFEPRELLARIRAVLRRRSENATEAEASTVMRFGTLEIDRNARTVSVAGALADLTSYQFDLLVAMAERAGRVLTRDQIMEAVRGRELEAFDRSIDVHMGRIRAAIEVDAKNPKRILTVRGVGYVFAKQQD
ncbi:response regulator transcription factor [Variovorax sp. RHLX14]|uniref:response regulator transcription factor n=1 Tax=Variovorax sp. RHLX14 TaxID=1259731 RepID=UPI003F47560A